MPGRATPITALKQTSKAWVLAWLYVWSCTSVSAMELQGQVVGVYDGETLTLRDAQQKTHHIRFAGIDAPEKAQPFGKRAQQQLSEWVYGAQVWVAYRKTDRYRRPVGKVTLDGEEVNIQMVHAGLAWLAKGYEREQTRLERTRYTQAELSARRQAIGLWADADPVPPCEWRSRKKQSSK